MKVQIANWTDYCARFVSTEGPKRGCSVPEDLEPGDVFDTGEILATDSVLYGESPGIWLTIEKAHRAAFYGWYHVDGMVSRCPATLKTLLLCARHGWPRLA